MDWAIVVILVVGAMLAMVVRQWHGRYWQPICIAVLYVAVVAAILHRYWGELSAETWLTALGGLVLVLYVYFTYEIAVETKITAENSARDIALRTRPVVTLEVKPLTLNAGEYELYSDEMLIDLQVSTVLRNHSNVNGYAWIRFEYWKAWRDFPGSRWEAELVGAKPTGDDYCGEEQLDVPAMYELSGHTSLSHDGLRELIRKRLANPPELPQLDPQVRSPEDLMLVVKIKTSPVAHLRNDDPVSTVAYRLKFQFLRYGGDQVDEEGRSQFEWRARILMIPFQTSYPFKSDWDDSHRCRS